MIIFKKRSPNQKISDLLNNFFESKSDAGRSIEATQQEALEKDFEDYIDTEGGESIVCEIMHEMACESLSPETYDKWEDVCKELFNNRQRLKGTLLPWE